MAKKKRRREIDWVNQLLNFFGVVLGVLIAFWLNSWAQNRKEHKVSVTALKNIRNELVKNSERVDSTVVAHRELYQFLEAYLQYIDDDMALKKGYRQVDSLMGVYPQYLKERSSIAVNTKIYQLSEVAWNTAVDAGVVANLDFDIAYKLNHIYDFQHKVTTLDETILENMKEITGRKQAFDNLRRTMLMSQILAGNLKDSSFYYSSIVSIDSLIAGK